LKFAPNDCILKRKLEHFQTDLFSAKCRKRKEEDSEEGMEGDSK
jgi:hypothetical protein